MTTTLTRLRQGGYLAKTCRHAVALDNMPTLYPPDLKLGPSAFLQSLFDAGNEFETRIGHLLAQALPPGRLAMIEETYDETGERTREGKRAKEEATFAAYLDPDVTVIFNARIGPRFEEMLSAHLGRHVRDEDRISEPDVIVLGDVLDHGLRAMTFIDVKWHQICSGTSRSPRIMDVTELANLHQPGWIDGRRDFYGRLHHEDWVQLAHYYRHAQTLGLVAPGKDGLRAGVIGKDEVVVWGDLALMAYNDTVDGHRCTRTPLAAYDDDFAAALDVIDNAQARDRGEDVPALTSPEWSSACAECPWRQVCLDELQAHGTGGHITLLPGITPLKAIRWYERGITDVASLARQDPLAGDDAAAKAIYTARVALDGHAHLAPDVDEVDLPRADVEIDIDAEFTDELVYMWGVRVTDTTTGEVTEHTFDDYTGTGDGERDAFVAMWALLADQVTTAEAAGRTVRIYHYSHVEKTKMRALADRYANEPGVPTRAQVDDLFDSGTVVDMYHLLASRVLWPTRSNSIKKLATFAGFTWRDETPGGDMSLLWYADACSHPDPQERDASIDRLRRYNLDDVHAQAHLRQWVTAAPLPRAVDIPPPA